jgi:hypothetical protein
MDVIIYIFIGSFILMMFIIMCYIIGFRFGRMSHQKEIQMNETKELINVEKIISI